MLMSIHNQSQALASIVSQLLDVSRIESEQTMLLNPQLVDLGEMIPRLVQQFSPEEQSHELFCRCESGCVAMLDADALVRIVNNLLSNACKYSPAGSPVDVVVRQKSRDGVEIVVRDHGIGMNETEIANAFEKFFRADHSGAIKGLGLGLHIVRELIHAQHGTINIDSKSGDGTTVTVWFPSPKEKHL